MRKLKVKVLKSSHVFLDKNGRYIPNLLHRISELDFEVIREKL